MARQASTADDIVKLKVTLQGIRPQVWRRLLVPAGATLRDLHDIIQTSMGWQDSHLHDFNIAGDRFGDPGAADDVKNEARLTLAGIVRSGLDHFKYTYDFGDDWEHQVVIEGALLPRAAGQHYPACIGGERACPPEDSGGPPGYDNWLQVRANPAHPDRKEIMGWIDADFDPEAFSVADTDARLAAQFRRVTRAKR